MSVIEQIVSHFLVFVIGSFVGMLIYAWKAPEQAQVEERRSDYFSHNKAYLCANPRVFYLVYGRDLTRGDCL